MPPLKQLAPFVMVSLGTNKKLRRQMRLSLTVKEVSCTSYPWVRRRNGSLFLMSFSSTGQHFRTFPLKNIYCFQEWELVSGTFWTPLGDPLDWGENCKNIFKISKKCHLSTPARIPFSNVPRKTFLRRLLNLYFSQNPKSCGGRCPFIARN